MSKLLISPGSALLISPGSALLISSDTTADPSPRTLTIADTGHQHTVKERHHTVAVTENA